MSPNKKDCWMLQAGNGEKISALDRKVVASDSVKTVKFQRDGANDPDKDQEVNTAGWGSLNNLGERPDTLYDVAVAVMDRGSLLTNCRSLFPSLSLFPNLSLSPSLSPVLRCGAAAILCSSRKLDGPVK
ncbi:hypothetical protein DPEC_G00313330 [Dallia pectoralis]|uniref:Uncharacterized protein n=1 Tax=Dallia pectoralis TaxID=75939 RepID=A0ACC2FBT6_DALPE|nr:hypothetical protein DPEC_G00313330 [Dallia pectoralis]